MSYTTADMVIKMREQLEAVSVEVSGLERLQRGIAADVAKVEVELEQAWAQLAETLIPSCDHSVLQRASSLLRLAPIAPALVHKRMQEHLASMQALLERRRADPLVANRENQVNEAQIRLAELDEALLPLQTSTATLEQEPYFEELLAYRYGSDAYAVKFFQLLYYTHWKNADLIVEKHGPRLKCDNFGALAARYIDEKTALQELLEARRTISEKLRLGEELLKQVQELEQGIEQAGPRTLALVRARVREHLGPLPDADVTTLLSSAPDADLAWRRIAGLTKKKEYLNALATEQVKGSLGELNSLRAKLRTATGKLNRPKNASRVWSNAEWQQRFGNDRTLKWQKRRERIQQTRSQIVEFHHYERWNPVGDLLWWDVISDGQLDGNFIPEVRSRPHHQHQPVFEQGRETFADVS